MGTPRNVAKFTEWITGICGALSVNGRKLALVSVKLPKQRKQHYDNTQKRLKGFRSTLCLPTKKPSRTWICDAKIADNICALPATIIKTLEAVDSKVVRKLLSKQSDDF